MKHFFRAVLLSLRYRWNIAAAVVCSLLIAVLWSASISTVFPVVKIVLEGKTAHAWVQEEIDETRRNIDQFQSEVRQYESSARQNGLTRDELNQIQIDADLKRDRIVAEKNALSSYLWIQPYITRYAPESAFQTLVVAMFWLLGTTIIKGILLVVSAILVARVASKTVMDLRRIYYRKALEIDQLRIDRMGTSNMMTHLSHNMLMVSGGLRMFYGKTLREPLKMLTCLAIAAYISLPLLLISLIVVPAGAWLIHSISYRMKRSTQREMEGMADVFQTLIETFKAIKTVRIFNRESTERRRFKRNSETLCRMQIRISLYDSLLRPISEVLGVVSIALSVLAGSYLVLRQETQLLGFQILQRPLKPSLFVLFYTMLAGATDPARKMSEIVNVLVRGGTASENLFRAFDVEPRIKTPENPATVKPHEKNIRFENVIFAYLPKQPVLRKVSFEIPFGQTVAIVGGNGSGKSTLMNLLARFYDPHQGQIYIDDVDIKEMNPRKLRRQIAWVTQDSVLFNGTIWENIAYGSRNATDEQILAAAKIARIEEFANEMELGMHSEIGDDGKLLSAGQRQRVALARAVLADPKILILDEATSQMDGQTEELIHASLAEFMKSRTTFVITHRRSSLKLADRVLVMHLGRLIYDNSVANADENSGQFQHLFAKSA